MSGFKVIDVKPHRISLFAFLALALGAAISFAVATPASWIIGPFIRPANGNPVITPNKASVFDCPLRKAPVHWEALHTFNPAAVVRDGKVVVLYRAEDDSGSMQIGMHTSRLGLAESSDGIHFTRRPTPVFFPANDAQKDREWEGGVEDPRIVESEDGTYILNYTQWNRTTYSIGVATSKDLVNWTKHGPALGAAGKYANLMYKSASIVTELVGKGDSSHLVAAKIHGKYWMYWGEVEIRLATSDDLIHWTPIEDASGQPVVLMHNRPGLFDSGFPEVGPPALLTSHGIVLLYNGKNAAGKDADTRDKTLDPATYAVGEALFSADDPAKLLERTERPIFKPEMAFERTGQYAAGTTFAEGLVHFHGRWFLYYGCADSLVGVAIYDPTNSISK